MSSLLSPEYVRHMKRIRLGLIKLMLLLYYVLSVFFCGHWEVNKVDFSTKKISPVFGCILLHLIFYAISFDQKSGAS